MPHHDTPPPTPRKLTRDLRNRLDLPCLGCAGHQRLAELVWYLETYTEPEPALVARELAAAAELLDSNAQQNLDSTRLLSEIHWRLARKCL